LARREGLKDRRPGILSGTGRGKESCYSYIGLGQKRLKDSYLVLGERGREKRKKGM